jgi:energy-converting hydrogenase B subunit D
MTVLQLMALLAVAAGGTAVVLTREPLRQALVVGVYGFMLAALFFVFQAADVALSEIVVSTVALPAMILLAAAKIREHEQEGSADDE